MAAMKVSLDGIEIHPLAFAAFLLTTIGGIVSVVFALGAGFDHMNSTIAKFGDLAQRNEASIVQHESSDREVLVRLRTIEKGQGQIEAVLRETGVLK